MVKSDPQRLDVLFRVCDQVVRGSDFKVQIYGVVDEA